MILAKMLGIFGRQKSALMMIEPPGQTRIARVLEVDDGILVAIKKLRFEKL